MSLFEQAAKEADRLKMYIFGDAGTGKTRTSLQFPNPALIDSERGSLHYGDEFDFYRLETSDPDIVNEAIDELLNDPGDFKTIIIDSITAIYDQMVINKEMRMKEKKGDIHYEIQPLDYKSIKTDVRILMDKLLSLDLNVIMTARSKAEYQPGEFMKQIGNKPEGHKDLPYMFDVVLELTVREDGTRMARVDNKDRTGKLPHEFEFSYEAFKEYIGIEALERDADQEKQEEDLSKRTGRSTKITLDGDQIYTAGVTAETLKSLEKAVAPYDPEDLREVLKENYEVESLLDLDESAAENFLRGVIEEQAEGLEEDEDSQE